MERFLRTTNITSASTTFRRQKDALVKERGVSTMDLHKENLGSRCIRFVFR